MKVLVHADQSVGDFTALNSLVDGVVTGALKHVSDRVTRVEVHLGDENGDKSGADDKRCMMEARLEGRRPVAVTHHADTFDAAVHGAAGSLTKVIVGVLGRSASRRNALGGSTDW